MSVEILETNIAPFDEPLVCSTKSNTPQFSEDLVFYVHVPFCTSKCHFCLWVSQISASDLTRSAGQYEAYTKALIHEIESLNQRGAYTGRKIKSIYFGGGTPSVLSGAQLSAIMGAILANNQKSAEFESATLEISPQTVTVEKLAQAREAGFDRISMGVQLFNDAILQHQGRDHSAPEAIKAYYTARQAGFDNINLDIMLGLPEATRTDWEETIETCLQLYPEHLSVYPYIPANTTVSAKQLKKGLVKADQDEAVVEQYLWAAQKLTGQGYLQYGQQVFERQGKRCNCDESYFQMKEEWVGCGAGAQSMLDRYTFGHSPNVGNYLKDPLHYDYNTEVGSDLKEIWFFVVRMLLTIPGINFAVFEHRIGLSFQTVCQKYPYFDQFIQMLERRYCLSRDEQGLRYPDLETGVRATIEMRSYIGNLQ